MDGGGGGGGAPVWIVYSTSDMERFLEVLEEDGVDLSDHIVDIRGVESLSEAPPVLRLALRARDEHGVVVTHLPELRLLARLDSLINDALVDVIPSVRASPADLHANARLLAYSNAADILGMAVDTAGVVPDMVRNFSTSILRSFTDYMNGDQDAGAYADELHHLIQDYVHRVAAHYIPIP